VIATQTPGQVRLLRIGTRGSALARWQAEAVQRQLGSQFPAISTRLTIIRPEGDLDKQSSLLQIGGRGVFASALQEALLAGSIDLAVHSTKDVPTIEPAGLAIAAFPAREDAHDAVVSRHGVGLAALPSNPVIGTSSRRRAVQVLKLRPDATIADLRGNIDTRLRKAETPEYDAIILAAAGLARMGWQDRIAESLLFDHFVPSPGQGALAIEGRIEPDPAWPLLAALDDQAVSMAVRLERSFLQAVGGGCTTPIGAHAEVTGEVVRFWAMMATEDGARVSHTYTEFAAGVAASEVPTLAARMMTDMARSWAGGTGAASQPLAGRRALLTGTHDLVSRLNAAFVAEGAPVLECPTLEVRQTRRPKELATALERAAAGRYDWLVVTSQQTVPALERFGTGRLAGKVRVAAVGTATAAALDRVGLAVDLLPGEQTAKGLVETFEAIDLKGARVLCLLGDQARSEVQDGLASRGAKVQRVESYVTAGIDTMPPHVRDAVRAGQVDIATFASPASVTALTGMLGADLAALSGACLVAMGPTTSEAMSAAGLPVHVVASQPSAERVVADCRAYFAERFVQGTPS